VYGGAAAAGIAVVLLATLVLGGGDDGDTTATTAGNGGVTTNPVTSDGVSPSTADGASTTAASTVPAGAPWSASVLPAIVADLDANIAGEPTEFVVISVLEVVVNASVPSATPGAYEQYSWTDYGTISGPSAADVDAGTPTFTATDIDWSAIGAQTAAAPSILGLPNGQVVSVVATAFDGETVRIAITVQEGSVTRFVLVDTEGQVVSTGP
ncbi:MAG TPA: hypothetical protein DCR14_07890, partial [Acidimicrobiaceae bacterium]|nr:hypothetical protein [Acidimicrobiaceae bacterium]